MSEQIMKALVSLRPGAQWTLRGDELEWLDEAQAAPSNDELKAEIERLASQPKPAIIDGPKFLARFTDDELTAIDKAAVQNPAVSRWTKIALMQGAVDVNGTTAQQAKAGLTAMKLLTPERADAIFSA